MARSRLLDPRFFLDAELADAERAAGVPLRLAYAALWCQADREGRFAWKPRELKLGCLPYDDVDFAAVLDLLANLGKIRRYEIDGRAYGFIPNFLLFQRPHPREAESQIPPIPAQGQPKASPRPAQGESRFPCTTGRGEGLPVVTESVTESVSVTVTESVADEDVPASPAAPTATGLSPELTTALQPFLAAARYPASIVGEIRAALDGMRGTTWPEATVIQALTDMQAANVSPFSPRAFRAFLSGVAREAARDRERRADDSAAAERASGAKHKRAAEGPRRVVPDGPSGPLTPLADILAATGIVRADRPAPMPDAVSADQKREAIKHAAAQEHAMKAGTLEADGHLADRARGAA